MIVDLILDRKENEKLISAGYTHIKNAYSGKLIPLKYNAHYFYRECMEYSTIFNGIADEITRALDFGSEKDVKKALCNYIVENDYNVEICDFINSVNWLE